MKERREYMFTLVRQWRESGLTRKEFCLQHGITLAKFGYWIARWKEDQSGGSGGLISGHLGRSATSGDVFVFLNRRRTHMKLLHWEHGGFVLYYKRLEGGTFPVPKTSTPGGELDWSDLVLMVEGIVVEKSRRRHRFSLKKVV